MLKHKREVFLGAKVFLLIAMFFGLTIGHVYALENGEATSSKREELKKEFEAKRTEVKDKVREIKETNIKRFSDQMIKRFQNAVERLESVSARIETRIAKIKANGGTVGSAETLLADAKTKIADAKTKIAALPTQVETALGATELKGAFEAVRKSVKEITDLIKSAHANLAKAISELKPGDKIKTQPATSTPTTTP